MNQDSSEFITSSSKLASVNSTGSPDFCYFFSDFPDDEELSVFPESLVEAVYLT